MRLASTVRASARVPLLQVVKVALATVSAWMIALAVVPGRLPVFAAVAALLVVQPSVSQSFGKAIERSFGVIVGVLVAFGLTLVFHQNSWIVLIAIVAAIFVAWALRLTPGTANQVPISAMLVLSIGVTSPDYALDRILETIIGAVIAVIINLTIVPPVLLAPAHESVVRLADELAATLDRLSVALATPRTRAQLEEMLITARLLRPMQEKAAQALVKAKESLEMNPRQSNHREVFDRDSALFMHLGPLVTRTVGMSRALRDHYDDSLYTEPSVSAISEELTRAAHDLRLLVQEFSDRTDTEDSAAGAQTALTAPLVIAVPHPEHWVLIGSLMEDLRRVREEILAARPEEPAAGDGKGPRTGGTP